MLQYILLKISKLALFMYGPLPDAALRARLLIEDIKNERIVGRKISP